MDRFTMSPQQRRDAVEDTLPALTRLRQHAVRLLLDYDHGRWFHNENFVRHALLDGPGPAQVGLAFPQLEAMVDCHLRRSGWVDDLGTEAFGVLWLACQLLKGELGELARHADLDTGRLVATTLVSVFSRDSAEPSQTPVQRF
jgi:hypothetical protein